MNNAIDILIGSGTGCLTLSKPSAASHCSYCGNRPGNGRGELIIDDCNRTSCQQCDYEHEISREYYTHEIACIAKVERDERESAWRSQQQWMQEDREAAESERLSNMSPGDRMLEKLGDRIIALGKVLKLQKQQSNSNDNGNDNEGDAP